MRSWLFLWLLFSLCPGCGEDALSTPDGAVGTGDGNVPELDAGDDPDTKANGRTDDVAPNADSSVGDGGSLPEGLSDAPDSTGPGSEAVFVPPSEQRDGDPEAGYQVLLKGAYVGCGLPAKMYNIAESLGFGMGQPPAPGSDTDLSYFLSAYTTWAGVKVVAPNCLTCHADIFHGEVILGLGATKLNYSGIGDQMTLFDDALIESLAETFGFTDAEKEELSRFTSRFQAVLPYIEPSTVGVSPADNLAAILFAHRDPETLEWSDELLMEPPGIDVVPIDVPAWWLLKKKNAMFHNAGGRGDHARIMMTASTLCVDSVGEAEAVDATMPDLRAFVLSLEAPAYPYEIDADLAEEGRVLFDANCSVCHGTYGEEETYPNVVVPLDIIGTDSMAAAGAAQFAGPYLDWFHTSFYGEISSLEPFPGYVPPPLDGIWLTGPYFHNGSVPTVAGVLNSIARPTYWRRVYAGDAYDMDALGWQVDVLDAGKESATTAEGALLIYDTTEPGYGNGGHFFGDVLSDDQRTRVIEYLKTL